MFQRLDKLRKNAFSSVCLFGENNNSTISGIWVWKGHDLVFELSDGKLLYRFNGHRFILLIILPFNSVFMLIMNHVKFQTGRLIMLPTIGLSQTPIQMKLKSLLNNISNGKVPTKKAENLIKEKSLNKSRYVMLPQIKIALKCLIKYCFIC